MKSFGGARELSVCSTEEAKKDDDSLEGRVPAIPYTLHTRVGNQNRGLDFDEETKEDNDNVNYSRPRNTAEAIRCGYERTRAHSYQPRQHFEGLLSRVLQGQPTRQRR
mmetsp:Transcript_13707/g.22358  ORF Transcript_13707/g.22358 Transcript_13707/m.22358 type:complete len:108 (+) Transcript_13707:381-704(+)